MFEEFTESMKNLFSGVDVHSLKHEIEELKAQKAFLSQQLKATELRLQTETQERKLAEENLGKLQIELEVERQANKGCRMNLGATQAHVEELEQEIKDINDGKKNLITVIEDHKDLLALKQSELAECKEEMRSLVQYREKYKDLHSWVRELNHRIMDRLSDRDIKTAINVDLTKI